ncbi:Nickel uptake substrate-specific transmembrane region, partial [Haemophilus influenzae]
KMLKVGKWII